MAASTSDAGASPRPLLAASVAVFRDGLVLVAERGRAPAQGLWSLPGGRVEHGETLAACALRELTEETGVTAAEPVFVEHVEMISADFHAVIAVFAARWLAGEAMPGEEARQVRWCRPAEVAGLATTPRLAAVVDAAAARMGER